MEEDKDYINLIHGDLTRATQIQNGMPDSIGVMSINCPLSIEAWLDRFLHLFEENVQHSFLFPKTIPIFGHPTVI